MSGRPSFPAPNDGVAAGANKPTAADNVAEREEQVAAITARARRLHPPVGGRPSPAIRPTSAAEAAANVQPPFDPATPAVSAGVMMESWEVQARASIVAALIVRGAVEVPAIPPPGSPSDEAGLRLRELTDYVYRLITMGMPEP